MPALDRSDARVPGSGRSLLCAPVRVADGVVWLDRANVAPVDEIGKVMSDLR